jgi:hypothetical protein
MSKNIVFLFTLLLFARLGLSTQLLVPMDETQTNHLKAYGISYWALENGVVMEWLLNYKGGSFLFPHLSNLEEELNIRGVKYQVLTDGQVNQIKSKTVFLKRGDKYIEEDFFKYDDANKNQEVEILTNEFKDFDY